MRLVLLAILTMIAFAANSVLNRLALADGEMVPAGFALIRLLAGAVMLLVLVWRRGWLRPRFNVLGTGALALYVLGFSFAYVSLETGIGALILFGGVQITMFVGAVISRDSVPLARWAGAALAFSGLVWLFLPGSAVAPSLTGAALMSAAALGWSVHSLLGRGVFDPLATTALGFLFAVPVAVLVFVAIPGGLTWPGVILTVMSGAVTSGLGYALWYILLPKLGASVAAVTQLTVPVIAMAGGALLLSEPLTLQFTVSSLLVFGGVGLSLLPGRCLLK